MTAESLTRSETCDHRVVSSFVHLRARPFLWGKQRTLYSFVRSVGRRRHGGEGVHTHITAHNTASPLGTTSVASNSIGATTGKLEGGQLGNARGWRERGRGKGEVRLKG